MGGRSALREGARGAPLLRRGVLMLAALALLHLAWRSALPMLTGEPLPKAGLVSWGAPLV